MIRLGHANHVVTTNLDGLHRKSGLRHHKELTCLHGDIYIERCTKCGHEEERDYNVRVRKGGLNVHDHSIGTCQKCGSRPPKRYTGKKRAGDDRSGLVGPCDKNCGTKDTHINFGEDLDDIDWNEAEKACGKADLCIVVGTSMSLRHVTHMPFMAKKTVIINLQKTPDDDKAHLRLWARADTVFHRLMDVLSLDLDPVPPSAMRPSTTTRRHVPQPPCVTKSTSGRRGSSGSAMTKGSSKVILQMEPTAVGVKVMGRTVTKVAPGSQAERAGVLTGWEILAIGGQKITAQGQAAADAITRGLANRKKEGKPFRIQFSLPPSVDDAGSIDRGEGAKLLPSSKAPSSLELTPSLA